MGYPSLGDCGCMPWNLGDLGEPKADFGEPMALGDLGEPKALGDLGEVCLGDIDNECALFETIS